MIDIERARRRFMPEARDRAAASIQNASPKMACAARDAAVSRWPLENIHRPMEDEAWSDAYRLRFGFDPPWCCHEHPSDLDKAEDHYGD